MLTGHNLGYDIGVLRAEMRRIGKPLPDLPIIDTMGSLAARVGKQAGLSVLDLLAEHGLPPRQPHHSAAGDAHATAAAACALLDLAASGGDFDMATLLAELAEQTVGTLPAVLPSGRATRPVRPARSIPDEHAIAHFPLSAEPAPYEIARWTALVDGDRGSGRSSPSIGHGVGVRPISSQRSPPVTRACDTDQLRRQLRRGCPSTARHSSCGYTLSGCSAGTPSAIIPGLMLDDGGSFGSHFPSLPPPD